MVLLQKKILKTTYKFKNLFAFKQIRENNFKISHILLILALIIIILPGLLSLPACIKCLDFSTTGQIGDTIGGITAPFINGIAAVLVFLAFKAQIKANEIFKNQEKARIIFDQIAIIQENNLENEKNIDILISRILELSNLNNASIDRINKVLYFTTEIQLAYELISNYSEEKEFFYKKLYYLYTIRYKLYFEKLKSEIDNYEKDIDQEYTVIINDLVSQIKNLNNNLNEPNKFKNK